MPRAMGLLLVFMLLLLPRWASAFTCDATFVSGSLDWCARDHGFNEGAVCGASALGGLGISGVPAMAAAPVLGNTWDRTNMMGAAKAAAHAGQMNNAVAAAICCQVHNPPVQQCLASRSADVAAWLMR